MDFIFLKPIADNYLLKSPTLLSAMIIIARKSIFKLKISPYPCLTVSNLRSKATINLGNESMKGFHRANYIIKRIKLTPMPKTLVITMNEEYPFFMARPSYLNNNGQILVRRVVKTIQLNHGQMVSKATFLKNLRNKNLVKVENLVEEDNNIHIFYENVESKYDWRDPQVITEVYNQLKNLTVYLVNIGVKAPLKSNRLGITERETLKYYLSIDFQWDSQKDDQFLTSFYHNELNKLFGTDFVAKSSLNRQGKASQRSPSIRQKPEKVFSNRKVSFATISSRQDRLAHLQKQMNLIKSSYQRMSPSRKESTADLEQSKLTNYNQMMSKSQSNEKNKFYRAPLLRDKDKLSKKWEDRKFSGDIKNNILSSKRLQEKESDIKSQRGAYPAANRLRERYQRQNNQQQIETINSKSRIEEMKYQQYINITKSQKNYLQEFIQLLDDDNHVPERTETPITSSKVTRPTQSSSKLEDALSLTTEALRLKTQEAILNSRKIINKVKAFPMKNSTHD